MKALLLHLGHAPRPFQDPATAVRALQTDSFDLVLSDVDMPGMDGFSVADAVAETLGTTPPKVLLVTGREDVDTRLDAVAPDRIIGSLKKPVDPGDLSRVLSLIERSRSCCPGVVAPLCPYVQGRTLTELQAQGFTALCTSSSYSQCPYFGSQCGPVLRYWVACSSHGPPPRPSRPGLPQQVVRRNG